MTGLPRNLGEDADTIAATAGPLAGAIYGLSGILESWLEKLSGGIGSKKRRDVSSVVALRRNSGIDRPLASSAAAITRCLSRLARPVVAPRVLPQEARF